VNAKRKAAGCSECRCLSFACILVVTLSSALLFGALRLCLPFPGSGRTRWPIASVLEYGIQLRKSVANRLGRKHTSPVRQNTVSNCLEKEARIVAKTKVDLETAAYAVTASCVVPVQNLRAFQATHDIRSVPQMQQYWAESDRKNLDHAKQLIALIRTN
jgi:hypothetical protein